MWSYRFIPFLLTGAGVLCLTGALRYPGWRPGEPEAAPSAELLRAREAPPDAAAMDTLAQAVRDGTKADRAWVQSAVWLRFHHPEARYQAEGSYVQAPGKRYRLEVRTRRDSGNPNSSGGLVLVCDGRDHWQASRVGAGGYREVKRIRLADLTDGPAAASLLRGPQALLESMQTHLIWVKRSLRGGRVELTGAWPVSSRAVLAPRGQPWPEALPRLCRLSLLADQPWPARVEWWGPVRADGPDRLLAEIEFRAPVFGQVLAEDECARLFRFDPGQTTVNDEPPAHSFEDR